LLFTKLFSLASFPWGHIFSLGNLIVFGRAKGEVGLWQASQKKWHVNFKGWGEGGRGSNRVHVTRASLINNEVWIIKVHNPNC
jgi:hypothetical protein